MNANEPSAFSFIDNIPLPIIRQEKIMDTNELADGVMKLDYLIGRTAYEIADTLRQQQAEIEALKKKIVSLEFLARKEK